MGREGAPNCEVALLAEMALLLRRRIALLAPNPVQPSTTPYKEQDVVALNLYYSCSVQHRVKTHAAAYVTEQMKF